MIYYDLGCDVVAFSTNIGEEQLAAGVVTPAYQAHSVTVAAIPDDMDSTFGVDALVTDRPGIAIGVRTADCVPVLLHDCRRRAVAAIHSGWRGTALDIVTHALSSMRRLYGSVPADIKAAIGPCIHIDAFEVGDEVYDAFARRGYSAFCRRMANPHIPGSIQKWHIDLPAVCRHQLLLAGVGDVFVSPLCTYECHDSLYSYRFSGSPDPSHRIITGIMLKDR